MVYKWLGMRVLDSEEVTLLYEKGALAGCYKLFPDGTESEITEITKGEIKEHYNCGGAFGEELPKVDLSLPDGKTIKAPVIVDISAIDCLDEMEYELWNVIQQYMMLFGIRTEDDDPDWATVKTVQDKIIEVFMDAGVDFKILTDEQTAEMQKQIAEGGSDGKDDRS